MNRKANLWENFNLLLALIFCKKRCCFFCFNNVCFAPPNINVLLFKITRQFWSVIRVFEKHFNVQFLGGAVVDLRFQFQEGDDIKEGFEKLQSFEAVAKQGATS